MVRVRNEGSGAFLDVLVVFIDFWSIWVRVNEVRGALRFDGDSSSSTLVRVVGQPVYHSFFSLASHLFSLFDDDPLETMATVPKCHNPKCSKPGPMRCSKCKGLVFCGRDCQMEVWDSHKALCKAIAKEPDATCLLLDGMGPLGPGEFYTEAVKNALVGAGVKVAMINVYKGSKLPEQVGSILSQIDRFTSCIVLGWGSGGCDIEKEFGASTEFRDQVVAWVRKGGRFIVQGENSQYYGNWPEWFDKSWTSADYYRTDHVCNAKSDDDLHWCKWYHKARGARIDSFYGGKSKCYNAKAVMLKGVAAEDVLFGTSSDSKSYSLVPHMAGLNVNEGLCAIALGKYGEGSVSFFGDVNAETDTCAIMAIIARGS